MSMESYQKAIEVCRTLIGIKNLVTDEDIEHAVNNVILMKWEIIILYPVNMSQNAVIMYTEKKVKKLINLIIIF